MNFNDCTLQRNIIFDDFPNLFRYQFWHLFLMSFGIDFGSILGPLWHQTSCFWVIIFVDDFLNRFLLFFLYRFLIKKINLDHKKAKFSEARRNARGCRGGIKGGGPRTWHKILVKIWS
jgi:hypothetical protein